jgi:Probable cobalt transporter subunit (CbtA)
MPGTWPASPATSPGQVAAGRRGIRAVLSAGLVAGLLAGLAAAIFHWFATEPLIQHAIDQEGAIRAAAGEPGREEVVSRRVQRVGMIIGLLVFGAAWGLFFGLAYWLLPAAAPGRRARVQALFLALAGYWTLGLFPHLKYPANPPGMGDPSTIGYRQGLYFGFLALSVMGALIAALTYHLLGRLGGRWQRLPVRGALAGIVYAVFAGAMTLGFPDRADPLRLAPGLVAEFQWLTLVGVSIFWTVLPGAFVLFARRSLALPA